MDAAASESDGGGGGGGGGIDISEDDETSTLPILDTIHEQQQQATRNVTTMQHLSGKGNHSSAK